MPDSIDAAVVQDDDWSASRTVESRCAMVMVVRPAARWSNAVLDSALGLGVQGAGGLVQDQHARVAQQGPGDGQALLLAAGEPVPAAPTIVS